MIPIDWTMIVPFMIALRVFAFIVGLATFLHFLFMTAAGSPRTPLFLKLVVIILCMVGAWIMACAVIGGANWSPIPAVVMFPMITFSLWIWKHGFHVCDFVAGKPVKMERK